MRREIDHLVLQLRQPLVLLLAVTTFLSADVSPTGAQFLKIGGGTRAIAMGQAFAGLADGLESIYWNPAGLMTIHGLRMSATHAVYFADMKYESFAIAAKTSVGALGLSAMALLSGQILKTTEQDPDGDIQNEHYTANDIALGLSYARSFSHKFKAGITLKLINQNIDLVSATGWAVDMGAHYTVGVLRNLRVGFVIRNFGPDMEYQGDGLQFNTAKSDNPNEQGDVKSSYKSYPYPLPLTFEIGFAIDIYHKHSQQLVLTLDGVNSIDQSETVVLGVEYQVGKVLALRAGLPGILREDNKRLNFFSDRGIDLPAARTISNRSASFGLSLRVSNIIIDYTFEGHQYLDAIQRFTMELDL